MNFEDLKLAPAIVQAVQEQGYTAPTPIQEQAIPAVLAGHDLLAGAQTGTGKTAGFTLPMLHRLSESATAPAKGAPRPIRALVLAPTRELAAQVEESVRAYGKHLKLKSAVIFGGVGMNPQIERIKKGIDILVATPGRLLDLAGQGHVDLSAVEILVLDEADRMLDMGFIHDVKKVLALLPEQKQSLLFSATFSDDIRALAASLLKNPLSIQVTPPNTTVERIRQVIYPVGRTRKKEVLAHLISQNGWSQVLVFTRTKYGANHVAEYLTKHGIKAMALHGNKSQSARTQALADFKSGELRALVATDIAARGIDIDELPHVVNYEIPNVPEDYVHRIGRTGRAGASGLAVTLVAPGDARLVAEVEKLIKKKVQVQPLALPGGERREGREDRGRRDFRDRRDGRSDGRSDVSARDSVYATRQLPGQPTDPFFDQPYEPAAQGEAAELPAWEKAARSAPAIARPGLLSPNITPRRQVAALFKPRAQEPGEADAAPSQTPDGLPG